MKTRSMLGLAGGALLAGMVPAVAMADPGGEPAVPGNRPQSAPLFLYETTCRNAGQPPLIEYVIGPAGYVQQLLRQEVAESAESCEEFIVSPKVRFQF